MAATDDEDPEPGPAGPAESAPGVFSLSFLIAVVVLTLVAGGGGFFLGLQILASVEQTVRSKQSPVPGQASEAEPLRAVKVKVLTPIMANLAGSPGVWMRLESSLVFRDELPGDADALAAKISEDIVAFIRTVSVKQIEGASGFQHLCEDLNDRVRVRSGGRVQELIIQGLIVE
jgi:flagellar protein FliL